MDISKAILAKSSQLNAADLIGDVVVTITDVKPGADDTEVLIVTDAFGQARPYMPPKTVLREIGKVWGRDTKVWVGRQMVVYNLPSVRYGGEVRGGVRIRALSHIEKPITYLPPQADGLDKGAKLTIKPLPAAAPPAPDLTPILAAIHTAPGLPELQAAWQRAIDAKVAGHPDVLAAKEARKGELSA